MVGMVEQPLHRRHGHSRMPLAQSLHLQKKHGLNHLSRQRVSNPACMRDQEVPLQAFEVVHPGGRKVTEPGVDAIQRVPSRGPFSEVSVTTFHPPNVLLGQCPRVFVVGRQRPKRACIPPSFWELTNVAMFHAGKIPPPTYLAGSIFQHAIHPIPPCRMPADRSSSLGLGPRRRTAH